MGLVIGWTATPNEKWEWQDVQDKLEEIRQFCRTLPNIYLSPKVFQFTAADLRPPLKNDDTYEYNLKVSGWRRIDNNPWDPGTSVSQVATALQGFVIHPAKGCESMEVYVARFPKHAWRRRPLKRFRGGDGRMEWPFAPDWRTVLAKPREYRDSFKLIHPILRKWKLSRQVAVASGSRYSPEWEKQSWAYTVEGYMHYVSTGLVRGVYRGHRKGRAASRPFVRFHDAARAQYETSRKYDVWFRYNGTAEEGMATFASPEFQEDMSRLMERDDFVTPPEVSSDYTFCKTQYASEDGIPNFVTAHLTVLSVLEKMRQVGFEMDIHDDGEFYETRSLKTLIENVSDYNGMVAGLAGALKDAISATGGDPSGLRAPILGFKNFEHLEADVVNKTTMIEDMRPLIEAFAKLAPHNTEAK
jgi:hypothetical protein